MSLFRWTALTALVLWAATAYGQIDKAKNLALVTVSTGYDASATSITLSTGDGAKLLDPATDGAFTLVWWNASLGDPSKDPNVEFVRCTARSSDVLTITRGVEGYAAKTHNSGGATYYMAQNFTAGMWNAVRDSIAAKLSTSASIPFDSTGWGDGVGKTIAWDGAAHKFYVITDPLKYAFSQGYMTMGRWIGNQALSQDVGSASYNQSYIWAIPWVCQQTFTTDSVNYECTGPFVGASTLGCYDDSTEADASARHYPRNRLFVGGRDTLIAKVNGISLVASPVTFTVGHIYWWVIQTNNTSATFRGVGTLVVPPVLGVAPGLGSNPVYTAVDIARTYDQYFPAVFASGATVTRVSYIPLVSMRPTVVR